MGCLRWKGNMASTFFNTDCSMIYQSINYIIFHITFFNSLQISLCSSSNNYISNVSIYHIFHQYFYPPITTLFIILSINKYLQCSILILILTGQEATHITLDVLMAINNTQLILNSIFNSWPN